jgi:hypothetical protein
MSAKCQKQTKCNAAKKSQFVHLVGERERLRWNDERMRMGDFGVGVAYHSARHLTNPRTP